jgi:hypothetical protein
MKGVLLTTVGLFALLVPGLASAQGGTVVYRPELHGYVLVQKPPAAPTGHSAAKAPADMKAKHEAMAADRHACCDKMSGKKPATEDDSHAQHGSPQ